MRELKYHIYLDECEYSRVIQSLISLKNSLIEQERYTDAVDDLLIKFSFAKLIIRHPSARKKKIKVEYR